MQTDATLRAGLATQRMLAVSLAHGLDKVEAAALAPPRVNGAPVDYDGLPARHRDTVRLYLHHGCDPGLGWRSILARDLAALVIVDDQTAPELADIYRWMVNHAPSTAWGSSERVNAWMRRARS